MRRKVVWLVATAALAAAAAAGADDGADGTYAPKLSLRLANGVLVNSGTTGGSAVSLAGVDGLFSCFLSPKFSLGVGYQVNFDFTNKIIPLSGFNFSGRYYFKGQGTAIKRVSSEVSSESLDRFAFFGGAELDQRNYYLGSNQDSTGSTVTGNYMGIAGLVGVDYNLSRHFELNLEGNVGLVTFAGSDNRIRVMGDLLMAGFSYLW